VRLNRQRAVLLVLDDCAWGLDTLAFANSFCGAITTGRSRRCWW
jgi:hypothetical protein